MKFVEIQNFLRKTKFTCGFRRICGRKLGIPEQLIKHLIMDRNGQPLGGGGIPLQGSLGHLHRLVILAHPNGHPSQTTHSQTNQQQEQKKTLFHGSSSPVKSFRA